MDEQLKMAAEAFLEGDDGMTVNMTKKEVKLSMIFKWYREDFGPNNEEVRKDLVGFPKIWTPELVLSIEKTTVI